jgi:hypothetical protein
MEYGSIWFNHLQSTVLVNNNLHLEYNCLFDLEFQRVSFFAFPGFHIDPRQGRRSFVQQHKVFPVEF